MPPRRRLRPLLELSVPADDAVGDAADQVPRPELAEHGGNCRLDVVEVRRRQEEEGEIDAAGADGDARLACGFPGCSLGHARL